MRALRIGAFGIVLLACGALAAPERAEAATLPFTHHLPAGTSWVSLPNCTPLVTAEDLCSTIPNATTVAQGFPLVAGPGSYHRQWTYNCSTQVCTAAGTTPPPPEAGCAGSCFCVDDGEGFVVTTSAPSTFQVTGAESPAPVTLPAAPASFIISVPYQSNLVDANDLAAAIGLPMSGTAAGTVTRRNAVTGALTVCTAGSPACDSLLLVPGEAVQVRWPGPPATLTYNLPTTAADCTEAPGPCEPGCQAPGEVSSLDLSPTLTNWGTPAPPGTEIGTPLYDMVRSTSRSSYTGGSAVCLATGATVHSMSADPSTPAAGQAFYYLVHARSACGDGTYGNASNGTPRQVIACAPAAAPLNTGYEPPNDTSSARDIASLPSKNVGDVHLHSGEYDLREVDLSIPGRGFDFIWRRTYRSRTDLQTSMGYQWDFSYDRRVEVSGANPANRVLSDGNGRRETWTPASGGCWTAPGRFADLCLQGDGTYTLTMPDRTTETYRPLSGVAAGKIQEIRDRNSNVMTFTYHFLTGRLTSITDTLGRLIQVGYNLDGLIASLTDFTGRQVTYTYYTNADTGGSDFDLKSWTTPAVTGTPTGNDFPLGKTTTYTYSRGFSDAALNHNLLTIQDPLGQVIVENVYTPTQRLFDHLTGQRFPGGSIVDYMYEPVSPGSANHFATMKTIVDDRAGNVREVYFDALNRLVLRDDFTGRAAGPTCPTDTLSNRPGLPLRGDDPASYRTGFTWNGDFLLTRIDRPNGSAIEYTYEIDLNPAAPRRSQGNLRRDRRLPGPLGGDQTEIVFSWQYEPVFNTPTHETDGRGNTTQHSYDAAGNRIHTQHRIPSIIEDWEYNAFGQMTAHILPDNGSGHRRRDVMTYYPSGPQTGYRSSEIVDAGPAGLALTTSYEYDAVGNVIRTVDPRGNDELFTLNALNQVVVKASRVNSPRTSARYLDRTFYDAADRVTRREVENRDELGVLQADAWSTTTYQYDALDMPIHWETDAGPGLPIVKERSYDPNDFPLASEDGEAVSGGQAANTVTSRVDERNLAYRTVRAEGDAQQSTTQVDYDADGNVRAVRQGIESAPRTTSILHDGFDRRVSATDPMGNVTTWHYDANGNILSERVDGELLDVPGSGANVRLSESSWQYDGMNRRFRVDRSHFDTQTQAPIGDGMATTLTFYTDASAVRRVEDDHGHATTTQYDRANRRTLQTDPMGNTLEWAYDANGNIRTLTSIEKSDLGGPDEVYVTEYRYDGLDRQIQSWDNAVNLTDYYYDSRDNLALESDPLARERRATFDEADRSLSVSLDMDSDGASPADPADIVSSTSWDLSSRLVGRGDDKGHTTASAFDALDRPSADDYADCTQDFIAYDVHDNAIVENLPNGTIVSSMHDLLNRVLHKSIAPGPQVSAATTFEDYQYDGLSRVVRAGNDASVVTRRYDSLGHVTGETETLSGGGPPATVTSVHDGAGNRIQRIYPGGRVVTTTFDALDRPGDIADGSGTIASYDYVGPSRVERVTYGNGTRADWQYDGILPNPTGDSGVKQVVRTTHTKVDGGAILDDRTYLWDAAGNKIERHDVRAGAPGYTHLYEPDAANRLVHTAVVDGLSATVRDTTYLLDGSGNRLSVTGPGTLDAGSYTEVPVCPVADDEMNQYTTTPAGSRSYDDAGNLVAISGTATLTYDYADRMVEYQEVGTGLRHEYAYDALGRRVRKTVDADGVASGPTVTRYILAGGREIEEQDPAGDTLATYVFGSGADEIISMQRGGADFYFHGDDLHSITALTDASGTVAERYEYDDYGRPIDPLTLTPIATPSPLGNPYLFAARRYDPEAGLYFARTRYLDPRAGRYTTRDPIGLWGDRQNAGNPYAYVGSRPQSRTDPTGMFDPKDVWDLMSKEHKAKWDSLQKNGWKLMVQTPIINHNPYWTRGPGCCPAIVRDDFQTNDDIDNVYVYNDDFMQFLGMGRDVQWKDRSWGVDFDSKILYLDAYYDKTAAGFVKDIFDAMDTWEGKGEFEGSLRGTAVGRGAIDIAMKEENFGKKLSWKEKRMIQMLATLQGDQAANVINALAKSANVTKPAEAAKAMAKVLIAAWEDQKQNDAIEKLRKKLDISLDD